RTRQLQRPLRYHRESPWFKDTAHIVRRVQWSTRVARRVLPHTRTEATHRAHPTPETRSRVEAQITGHAGSARRSPILSRHIPHRFPIDFGPNAAQRNPRRARSSFARCEIQITADG